MAAVEFIHTQRPAVIAYPTEGERSSRFWVVIRDQADVNEGY